MQLSYTYNRKEDNNTVYIKLHIQSNTLLYNISHIQTLKISKETTREMPICDREHKFKNLRNKKKTHTYTARHHNKSAEKRCIIS